MESADLIFNAENVRMLVLLAFGTCGFMWIKTSSDKKIDSLDRKIDGVEASLSKKIDNVEASLLKAMDAKIDSFHAQLKSNDFAHLNSTIEALTFTLEKNGYLKPEDRAYVNGRLDK